MAPISAPRPFHAPLISIWAAQLFGVEAVVGSIHCGILEGYVFFLAFYETPLNKSDNSCRASSFGLADRATSILSVSLRDGPIWFGVACRTHRLL